MAKAEKKTKTKAAIKPKAAKKPATPDKTKAAAAKLQDNAPIPTRGGYAGSTASAYEVCGSEHMQDESRNVNRASAYPFDALTLDASSNSFFVPAHVEREGFVSDAEWVAEQRAQQAIVVNRLVGAVRRHVKRTGTEARYSVKRTVYKDVKGVRVTRTK